MSWEPIDFNAESWGPIDADPEGIVRLPSGRLISVAVYVNALREAGIDPDLPPTNETVPMHMRAMDLATVPNAEL